mgnify:FL=1
MIGIIGIAVLLLFVVGLLMAAFGLVSNEDNTVALGLILVYLAIAICAVWGFIAAFNSAWSML